MDSDPMEECRSLLRRRNEETFFQRFNRKYFKLPSQKVIGLTVMACFSISIALLLTMQMYSPEKELFIDFPAMSEADEEAYSFNGTHEMNLFLQEWKRGENIVKNQRKQLLDLYKKVAPHRIGKSKNDMELLFAGNETMPLRMLDCALILEHVKRKLTKCISVDILPEECLSMIRDTTECDPNYPYRTINGSCNNLINPTWGQSGQYYLRILKPHYSDDVSIPRVSVYGVDLPNPRLLSSRIYDIRLLPDAETTMLFMNFGLFIDHDFIKTLLPIREVVMQCCEPEVVANPSLRHPSCWEHPVPFADPFYISRNITCLNFYRSVPIIGKCPGRREQSNLMTAYLDLSDTYGPTNEESENLRAFQGGKLRSSDISGSPMLPLLNESGDTCFQRDVKYKCFSSGDNRVNMHMEIMAMHTVWFREHNRLAEALQRVNPHWSDEKLFQEARKINIAEFQHVVYKEWLTNVLGKQLMKQRGLNINPKENYDGYDETAQSGIFNAFSSAAFRFGHTLVPDTMEFRGPNYKLRKTTLLRWAYTNPSIIYKHGLDDIIRGMAFQRTHQPERHTTPEIRNRLLQKYYSDFGLDLTMITIKRGRDHGLPSYTKWRKFCQQSEINSWDDMYKVMDKIRVDELREMYMSVDDVDLVPGAASEPHLEGAMIGPTYACIISRQFLNARVSDRFWFENRGQPGSFTPDQLAQIYKSNFAKILCDSSDELETIQKFPFLMTSKDNPMKRCDELPEMDLSFWIDDSKK